MVAGAAALLPGPVRGEGGGEEEAAGGHRPGQTAGGGPTGSHTERTAERDRTGLVRRNTHWKDRNWTGEEEHTCHTSGFPLGKCGQDI